MIDIYSYIYNPFIEFSEAQRIISKPFYDCSRKLDMVELFSIRLFVNKDFRGQLIHNSIVLDVIGHIIDEVINDQDDMR